MVRRGTSTACSSSLQSEVLQTRENRCRPAREALAAHSASGRHLIHWVSPDSRPIPAVGNPRSEGRFCRPRQGAPTQPAPSDSRPSRGNAGPRRLKLTGSSTPSTIPALPVESCRSGPVSPSWPTAATSGPSRGSPLDPSLLSPERIGTARRCRAEDPPAAFQMVRTSASVYSASSSQAHRRLGLHRGRQAPAA